MGQCTSCKCSVKPYIKVLIITIISFGGLSGIYSFLSKPGELKILNDDTTASIWGDKSYNGIICELDESPYLNTINLDCNNIAQQMSENITMNPSWDCHSKLEYSNLFVFENQPFLQIFTLLIIFAFISQCFTVIHDWRLIKHKNDISQMIEWFPNNHDGKQLDETLCGKYQFECCCKVSISEETKEKPCWMCLVLVLILIFGAPLLGIFFSTVLTIIVSIIPFYLFIYPFCCCTNKSWQRLRTFNGNICKISYIWIGVAKFTLIIVTTLLTFYGFTGFNIFIHEYYNGNPNYADLYGSCSCYCHYVFPSTNFYGLMIVTYLLILNNLAFLYQHSFKSMPYKLDYLLTQRYIVPINYIGLISEDTDPTKTILFRKDMNPKINQNELGSRGMHDKLLMFVQDEEQEPVGMIMQETQNALTVNESKLRKKGGGNTRKCLAFSYGLMFVVGVFWIILFTAIGFIPLGLSNQNEYPHWLAQLIMWIGIVIVSIIALCCIIFMCLSNRR